ncbi:MAG: trigger factor, partial [Marmoricola sp.]
MKSAVESIDPTRAKLTVEVPFEELKPSLDAAYQRIAKQVNIPGFRKGKVPPPVIDRQIGRGVVIDEAVNDALPRIYVQALQDNDLVPLAQPEIDITRLEDNQVLEFTAEVVVRPPITLPAYDGVTASVEDVAVTDADVDEQVQALRERFATLKDVERAVANGDFVTIDLSATHDGEPIEGGELSGFSYQVGKGDMLPGIDEVLA